MVAPSTGKGLNMATVTKSRARKPLAEGMMAYSWSNMGDEGERFNVSVRGAEHWFKTSMTPDEAIYFMSYVAGHMTETEGVFLDKRSTVEKLRALADKLEAKGNLQRMGLTG